MYLLAKLRSNLADHVSKLYSQALNQSKVLVTNYCKNGFFISTNFVNLVSWLDCRLDENLNLNGFQTSLIEFCEFVTRFKEVFRLVKVGLEHLEVFFAVFVYFGFNHFFKRDEWDKCLEWMRKVFGECLDRDGGEWGYECYLVYRTFDGIDHAKRGTLKEVSDAILDGVMGRVDKVEKEIEQVRLLIENECFTESLLKTIKSISTKLQNFFHITHHLSWKISTPSAQYKSLHLIKSFNLLLKPFSLPPSPSPSPILSHTN